MRSVRMSGQAEVPGRTASRSFCFFSFLGRRPSSAQSLLSCYDDVSNALWRVGSRGGPYGCWRGRKQEQGQGVA
jgi:hypothetical protein